MEKIEINRKSSTHVALIDVVEKFSVLHISSNFVKNYFQWGSESVPTVPRGLVLLSTAPAATQQVTIQNWIRKIIIIIFCLSFQLDSLHL